MTESYNSLALSGKRRDNKRARYKGRVNHVERMLVNLVLACLQEVCTEVGLQVDGESF